MATFEGIYSAVITPMTADHALNEAAFRQVIERTIEAGVDGFWVAGGSGESVLLDDAENRRLGEWAVDQAAARARVIMHVGAPTTRRAAAMAEHAAAAGVDAICCVPPFFYPQTDSAVVEHYRVIAAATGLPFFAYNLPPMTNCEITPALMAKIQERVPQLAGVKHSAVDFGPVRAFVSMGLACFIGRSWLMLPALAMGAAGCIDGWPGVAPEPWVDLWRAFRDGDMAAAQAAQDRGIAVCELMRLGHFHAVLKATTGYRYGIYCGTPRPPGQPLTPEQDEAVRSHLAALDLLPAAAA